MHADEFLARLDGVRPSSRGWIARCAAHDDNTPSLTIREGERGLLLKCFAGCSTEQIVAALNLTMSDLFYDAPRSARQRAMLPPRPQAFDFRRVSSDQLQRAEGLRLRTDRTLVAATGVALAPLSDDETDAMMNAVADAYADRDLADCLESSAFRLRKKGIHAEMERYAPRR